MIRSMVLNLKSLREQVYEHLREAINRGDLSPGSFIDQGRISEELGVSKTPLRDALIQLESEGFVSILPRRGVIVNALTLDEIRHLYEIVGALEGVALFSVFERLGEVHLRRMRSLNQGMAEAIRGGDFDAYYDLNLSFHEVFLDLSDNRSLVRTVSTCKQRLYDFPRRERFVRDWELASIEEHGALIALVKRGETRGAADFLRDVHWSFAVQEPFVLQYYFGQTSSAEGGELES